MANQLDVMFTDAIQLEAKLVEPIKVEVAFGLKGDTGKQGQTGAVGPKGDKGEKGDTGLNGKAPELSFTVDEDGNLFCDIIYVREEDLHEI